MTELDIITRERNDYLDWYFIESQKVLGLRKVLKEIKDILIFNKKELDECLYNDIDGQILQKIKEVEDG